jgi:hypothetical protein
MNRYAQESMSFREGVDRMVDRAAAYALALEKLVRNYEDIGLINTHLHA